MRQRLAVPLEQALDVGNVTLSAAVIKERDAFMCRLQIKEFLETGQVDCCAAIFLAHNVLHIVCIRCRTTYCRAPLASGTHECACAPPCCRSIRCRAPAEY